MQIGRQQSKALGVLLKSANVPIPDVDQILRLKRDVFAAAHAIDGLLQLVHVRLVGDRGRIRFQIPLGRRLPGFHFLNGLGNVHRPHVHGDRKIDESVLQQGIPVEREQVERRQGFEVQDIVIESVAVKAVASFRGGRASAVRL